LTGAAPVTVGQPSGLRRLSVAAAVVVLVVAADQLTKWWAVSRLSHGTIHLISTLDLQLTYNTGSAFSLLQGQDALLVVVAALIVAALSVMVWRARSNGRAAVLGLILGGALGNLADRLFRGNHGAVVDFVALHFWPTFNVADASIVVGCVLLVASLALEARTR
jgi:signal peptidase II